MAATALGTHAKGSKILLVDRNPKTEPGKKTTQGWICGDAVSEHHAKFVHERLGITFGTPEIENRVDAVFVCSPDRGVSHPFEGSGFLLDRPKFANRLLNEALKTGNRVPRSNSGSGSVNRGQIRHRDRLPRTARQANTIIQNHFEARDRRIRHVNRPQTKSQHSEPH